MGFFEILQHFPVTMTRNVQSKADFVRTVYINNELYMGFLIAGLLAVERTTSCSVAADGAARLHY